MKKQLCAFALLFFGLFVVASAKAADISGDWTAAMTMPNGEIQKITFTFSQNGQALTGLLQRSQGSPIEISNGKIDGNNFSFDVSFNGMTVHHFCTVNGDELLLKTKSNDNDQGEGLPPLEMTLKREKNK